MFSKWFLFSSWKNILIQNQNLLMSIVQGVYQKKNQEEIFFHNSVCTVNSAWLIHTFLFPTIYITTTFWWSWKFQLYFSLHYLKRDDERNHTSHLIIFTKAYLMFFVLKLLIEEGNTIFVQWFSINIIFFIKKKSLMDSPY